MYLLIHLSLYVYMYTYTYVHIYIYMNLYIYTWPGAGLYVTPCILGTPSYPLGPNEPSPSGPVSGGPPWALMDQALTDWALMGPLGSHGLGPNRPGL